METVKDNPKTNPRMRKTTPGGNTAKINRLTPEEREFYVPFGETIRHARVVAGLKQTDVATALGVSTIHVSDMENAYSQMTVKELTLFCKATGTDPNTILRFAPIPDIPVTGDLSEQLQEYAATDPDTFKLVLDFLEYRKYKKS